MKTMDSDTTEEGDCHGHQCACVCACVCVLTHILGICHTTISHHTTSFSSMDLPQTVFQRVLDTKFLKDLAKRLFLLHQGHRKAEGAEVNSSVCPCQCCFLQPLARTFSQLRTWMCSSPRSPVLPLTCPQIPLVSWDLLPPSYHVYTCWIQRFPRPRLSL
jgi:hypothetical protein